MPPQRAPGALGARRAGSVKDMDDERFVAELYREYHRPLLSFVMKLVGGDRPWAEDVVQETMIRAWRSVDRLDGDTESLMPWLATVARRVAIDDRRRKPARPQEAGEASPESPRVHGGTSVDRADLARFDVRVEGSDRILLSIRVWFLQPQVGSWSAD